MRCCVEVNRAAERPQISLVPILGTILPNLGMMQIMLSYEFDFVRVLSPAL